MGVSETVIQSYTRVTGASAGPTRCSPIPFATQDRASWLRNPQPCVCRRFPAGSLHEHLLCHQRIPTGPVPSLSHQDAPLTALCPGPTDTEFATVAGLSNSKLFRMHVSGQQRDQGWHSHDPFQKSSCRFRGLRSPPALRPTQTGAPGGDAVAEGSRLTF